MIGTSLIVAAVVAMIYVKEGLAFSAAVFCLTFLASLAAMATL